MNTVLGGVLALVVANWVPHLVGHLIGDADRRSTPSSTTRLEPVSVLAWPLLTFVGVLMVTFVVQSVQFVKPGRTMATIAGTVLAVAYVGLLGSFIIQMRWLDGPLPRPLPLVVPDRDGQGGRHRRLHARAGSPAGTSSGPA